MRVGSLFSGIGGIDLGFEQAGFNIAWAIEKDAAACKTYRFNFPNVNLIEKDIRNVIAETLEKIDVLVHRESIVHSMVEFMDKSIMTEANRYARLYKESCSPNRGQVFFPIISSQERTITPKRIL